MFSRLRLFVSTSFMSVTLAEDAAHSIFISRMAVNIATIGAGNVGLCRRWRRDLSGCGRWLIDANSRLRRGCRRQPDPPTLNGDGFVLNLLMEPISTAPIPVLINHR